MTYLMTLSTKLLKLLEELMPIIGEVS